MRDAQFDIDAKRYSGGDHRELCFELNFGTGKRMHVPGFERPRVISAFADSEQRRMKKLLREYR